MLNVVNDLRMSYTLCADPDIAIYVCDGCSDAIVRESIAQHRLYECTTEASFTSTRDYVQSVHMPWKLKAFVPDPTETHTGQTDKK